MFQLNILEINKEELLNNLLSEEDYDKDNSVIDNLLLLSSLDMVSHKDVIVLNLNSIEDIKFQTSFFASFKYDKSREGCFKYVQSVSSKLIIVRLKEFNIHDPSLKRYNMYFN